MKVILENVALVGPQKSWVKMGLPKPPGDSCGLFSSSNKKFDACVHGKELFVEADLTQGELLEGTYTPEPTKLMNFAFSPWVTDELEKVIPYFGISRNGINYVSQPTVFWAQGGTTRSSNYWTFDNQDASNPARRRIILQTQIPEVHITIRVWFDVFSNQDVVPFEIKAIYGNTTDDNKLFEQFGSLQMYSGEATKIYHANRKGLRPRILRSDLGKWETEIVSPKGWLRARAHDAQGVMLCLPPYDKLVTERESNPELFDKRYATILAVEQAPICGIADVWDGSYLSFGNIPKITASVTQAVINQSYRDLINDANTLSDDLSPRRYGQPPNSGQTGEQPDFGASKCELAVSLKRPFSLWAYRHSCEAWSLRPYHNLERDGSPVKAINHPNARTYNLRPDGRFSSADMLGWPNPVPYFENYGTSDDEHRSDNLLLGVYALTQSPSLKETILAMIENEKMNIQLRKGDAPIGAPRGWGRPLLSLSHMLALGFNDVRPMIDFYVDYLYRNASMFKIPQTPQHSVRTIASNGGKYGWKELSGNDIRAWVPWEESILVIGLYAIYNTTGNTKALQLALEISKTISKHAFFKSGQNWFACYAVRWDASNPGIPLPDSSYVLTNPPELNKDVFVYGMQTWMIPSLKIMIESKNAAINYVTINSIISDTDVARANEIINFYAANGEARNLTESGWWAV